MLKIQEKRSNTFFTILALPATAMGFALSTQIAALSWILTTKYGLAVHDIGLVWAAGPIAGIFGQVIIGAWSDRVWLWRGRRRPFIVVGGTIAALALLALPNIDVISSALGFEGILGVTQFHDALRHESRPDEQRDGQSDLRRHQDARELTDDETR